MWREESRREQTVGNWTKDSAYIWLLEGGGSRMELSGVRTGGILSSELGETRGLVGFPVPTLVGFHAQRSVVFCGKFRDWWLLFKLFT